MKCARCGGSGWEPACDDEVCWSCLGSGMEGDVVYLAMNAVTGRVYSSTDGAARIVYVHPSEELQWADSWVASRSFPRPLRGCPPRELGQR